MIEGLAQLLPIGQEALATGFVVFLRVGAIMALMPAFGEQSVPMRVRLAAALCFTFIVAPAVAPEIRVTPGALLPVANPLAEVVIGLAMGMIFRLLVMILQIAGAIAAQSTSLSQILGGAGVEPQPAIGHVMYVAGLALAVMFGLHVRAAQAMVLSYDMFPVGAFPDAGVLAEWGVGRIAWAFGLAATLAMPFVIASLVYNLALGVINRAMPQLMVAMVGAPAITAGGLILLFATLPMILEIWQGVVADTLAAPFEVPR